MPAAGEKFWHFEVVKTGFTRGNARRRRKKNWHFEIVKTGFTRRNARRRRKKIGTFRLPQAKKIAFGT